jgi:predicted anti-sigma-YlaC factor YlaD
MAIAGGFVDLGVLTRSQVPFAMATWLVRLAVALTIGLGVAIFVRALLEFRSSTQAVEAKSP